ncbi:MAG: M14 family zinc carboxypeptidase [Bradymonadaceae bacterium]
MHLPRRISGDARRRAVPAFDAAAAGGGNRPQRARSQGHGRRRSGPDDALETSRRVDDDPEDAYFVCDEGKFINWDGVEWTSADAEYGLDLNRNFPGQWEPFEMFGMDAGSYPLSEPESRSVVDAFAEHPHIACGLTMHTYSGAVLTQPYREDSSLDEPDIELMELLAEQLAEGTGWDVYRSYPDFAYDEDQPIVGVWADTMTTVFGVPGYTIELWDPFEYWDVDVDDALDFSFDPDLDKVREMLDKLAEDDRVADWTSVDHPQLGDVEIGGLEYLRTIRNPPAEALAEECERAWTAVERTRRSLPSVETRLEVEPAGDRRYELQLILENTGFLPTSGISRGKALEPTPEIAASASLEGDGEVLDRTDREFDHLAGWGQLRTGPGRHPIYARLPKTSQRDHATWTVEGEGTVDIDWIAGRAGRGTVTVDLDDE